MTRAVALLLCAMCCWLGACSLLVDPETKAARCVLTEGAPDPCPHGRVCRGGRCEPLGCGPVENCGDGVDDDCDGKVDERIDDSQEVCGDRKDNDCDGQIDEREDTNLGEICGNGVDDDCDGRFDEGHDQDGDGTPWCGNASSAGGGGTADCDDFDPSVHPGLDEICDGRDNDCDNRVDETTSKPLCSGGLSCIGQRCRAIDCTPDGDECLEDQRCDPTTLRCVAVGCTPDDCPAPQFCDQVSGECRSTRRPNGDPCVTNGDCMSGVCADRIALRIGVETARVCVKACCSDADCEGSERCHVSGSGARSCLPRSLSPRANNAPSPCTQDEQCELSQTCALVSGQSLMTPADPTRQDLVASSCASLSIGFALGDGCGSDQVCASKTCVPSPGIYPASVCSRPCGSSKDCEELGMAADGLFVAPPRSYCRFVTKGPGRDYLPICVLPQSTGPGGFGTPCANGTQCQEGACVGAGGERPGMCSIACCRDRDCPALNGNPTKCRPVAFGEHFEMRCMP